MGTAVKAALALGAAVTLRSAFPARAVGTPEFGTAGAAFGAWTLAVAGLRAFAAAAGTVVTPAVAAFFASTLEVRVQITIARRFRPGGQEVQIEI